MKKYKYRGLLNLICALISFIILLVFTIIRYTIAEGDLYRFIIIVACCNLPIWITAIFNFVKARKMTEEQFEEEQKKLRMGSDEREMRIRQKASLMALVISSLLCLLACLVFLLFDLYSIAITCAVIGGGMWIVDFITIAVYSKKM